MGIWENLGIGGYRGFSRPAARLLQQAVQLAGDLGCEQADTSHLLLAMLRQQGAAAQYLTRKNITEPEVRRQLAQRRSAPVQRLTRQSMAPDLRRTMDYALIGAQNAHVSRAEPEHLLCAMLEDDGCAAGLLLAEMGLSLTEAVRECRQLSGQFVLPAQPRVSASIPRGSRASDKYCRDLTRRAAEGELDPVFCREAELDRMVEILCRRQKNDPCLIGEPGVGKTALAEGLALRIAAGQVPRALQGRRLLALDMVPENRMRLVIFSQVLAMLVSGLLGSHLMLDGLGSIFKGRFNLNSLLTFTFIACCVDAASCLVELRIPCCAAFCLEMTMAMAARCQRRSTEMGQMDTLRKAVRLKGIAKVSDYYEGKPGLVRGEAEVEDFMDTYSRPSTPEKVQGVYALLSLLICIGIAVFAGMLHGTSLGVQILATSLLVAVPASFFISYTRPMAVLEKRLHMVGTVLCGWEGVKDLSGKAVFPLRDEDLFPLGSTKLNGVKFYGKRSPDEVVSLTASLITAAGGGLVPVFQQLMKNRSVEAHPVKNFQNYGTGGIGGEVCGEPVLLGSLNFLQDMGVVIPEGTMVNQAVYAAIDGQLCAVFAISYAKMRSAAAGLVTLCGHRSVTPVILCGDFMLTESFLQSKFGVKTRRIVFPTREVRNDLLNRHPDPDAPTLAITTRDELVSAAYAVTGARSLRSAATLGTVIHLIGGILGMLTMLALGYLGSTELLTPTNVLLYQLIWMIPGFLVTEWTRAV